MGNDYVNNAIDREKVSVGHSVSMVIYLVRFVLAVVDFLVYMSNTINGPQPRPTSDRPPIARMGCKSTKNLYSSGPSPPPHASSPCLEIQFDTKRLGWGQSWVTAGNARKY